MKIIRRILKSIVIMALLAITIVSTFYIKKGYDMYKEAVEKTDIVYIFVQDVVKLKFMIIFGILV